VINDPESAWYRDKDNVVTNFKQKSRYLADFVQDKQPLQQRLDFLVHFALDPSLKNSPFWSKRVLQAQAAYISSFIVLKSNDRRNVRTVYTRSFKTGPERRRLPDGSESGGTEIPSVAGAVTEHPEDGEPSLPLYLNLKDTVRCETNVSISSHEV